MRFVVSTMALTLVILVSISGSAGARGHIEFRGQRYYPTLAAMPASVGIGFDPINERVLSETETDVCGGNVVNRQGNNGVSWDPVTQEFWMINGNLEVYRFDANNNPEVIFQIPSTFDVPGVGPQTLHSPQGLAIDMNHIYVVDFGPEIGEPDSGQWFKFTRTGDPVASSATTNFNAHLQDHANAFGDAPVDGITWIPPGTPMDEGLFYVAVEHTGIMVMDENGTVLDDFLWTENGLVYGDNVPFAFAGITVDPATGDLYFVENAGQQMHIWIRLEDGPQSIVHGVASPRIVGPDDRCQRRTLFSNTNLFFSLTYRTVDGLLWTNSFNSGEIFTIDPLTGKNTSLGFPGVTDAWGMGYDEERDVIYLYQEFPKRLHVLDPNTLGTTVLNSDPGFVRELAFNSDDKFIYGVDASTLVRFDRDTGARTEVGPTVNAAGLAYDPIAGQLVGYVGGTTLYNINPATGQAQIRAHVPGGGGWEGLAIIPVEPVTTAAAPVVPRTLTLRAHPNPVSSRSQLDFKLPRPGSVKAAVYDLAGRRIATLFEGNLAAGPQSIRWDGRDQRGQRLASGTYLLELTTPWERGAAKISVVR